RLEAAPLDLEPAVHRDVAEEVVVVQLPVAPVVQRDPADERVEGNRRRRELVVSPDRCDRGGQTGVLRLWEDDRAPRRTEHARIVSEAQRPYSSWRLVNGIRCHALFM